MTTPMIISNEQAVPWTPSAEMHPAWNIEIKTQTHTGTDRLVLEVESTPLNERVVERWHLCFAGVASFRLESVGFPGNLTLTRYAWSRQYRPHEAALRAIEGSEWLATCRTAKHTPGDLTHFVIYEAHRSRVWHIAAERCQAQRMEPGAPQEEAEPSLVALVGSEGR